MSTKFKQNVQIAGEINATTIVGDGSGLTNVAGAYTNSDVDLHLNQSNPTAGYVLTWNGVDYSWTANGTGAGLGDVVDDITPQLGGTLDANGNSIDMDGNELILDADADTSITADTDDTIDFKIGGIDAVKMVHGSAYTTQSIISTLDNSYASPQLKLYKNSSSPANWDYNGVLSFRANDSALNETTYAQILGRSANVLDGSEEGSMMFYVAKNGSIQLNTLLYDDKVQFYREQKLEWYEHKGTNYDCTLDWTTPTADRTITLPDATGTVLLTDGDGSNLTNVTASSVQVTESSDDNVTYNVLFSDTAGSGNVQMTPIQDDGGLSFNPNNNQLSVGSVYLYSTGGVVFEGTNDAYETFFNVINPTADRNIYLPDAGGNVVLDSTLNASIDTHLNQSNPTSGYVLSWNGSDYAWVVNNGTVFDLVQDLTPQLGGNLDTNGANISFGDTATPGTNGTLSFGADNDLQIYHNTSDGHNYMQMNDKRLYIKAVDDGLTGPYIIFDHETTSPSTVDFSTVLAATSRDSAGASQTIGQMTFGTPNVTSGSFRGSLRFNITDSNGISEYVLLDGNSDIIDLKKAVRFSSAFTFPTTDGTANQVLQTNGSGVVTWATVSGGGGGTPGGSNTEVQFNNAGAFAGDSDFTYNSTTNVLTVGSIESNAAGTPTITSNSAVNISVGSSVIIQQNSGGGGFRLGNMTTTERNALSSANGEMIYNTTDNKLQGYENGSWTNLIGSGTYSDSNVDAHLNQSNPTSGYVLSWNGSDYAWVTNAGGGGLVDLVDDTTPQLGGNLDTNDKNIVFGDSSGTTVNRLKFGAGSDLEIYHNAINSIIQTTNTHTFKLMGGTNSYITATPSNAVSIYHGNGSKKFETTSTGVKTTGEINVNNAYSLPTAIGTSGQVLAVPSSGTVLEFANAGSGGGNTDILTFETTSSLPTSVTQDTVVLYEDSSALYLRSYRGSGPYVGFGIVNSAGTTVCNMQTNGDIQSTNNMVAKQFIADGDTNSPGQIMIQGANTSNAISLTAPSSVPGNVTFTLPTADGTNGQVLQTDGNGVLSFTTVSGGGGGTGDISFSASDISTNAATMNFKVDANNDDTGYEGYYFYGGPTSQGHIRFWTNDSMNETAIKFHVDGTSYYSAMLQKDDQFKFLLNEHGGNIPARVYNMANGSAGHLDLGTRHADAKIRVVDSWTGSLYYALPRATPNNGDVLTASDASGTLAWSAPSGGGDVVDDTSPQLGGNLDVNGKDIVSASNGDIEIKPDGTGNVYMQFNDPDAGELIINKPPTTDTDTLLLQDCHQVWNTTATTNGTAVAIALHPGTDSGSTQAQTFLRAVRGFGDRGTFEINCKKYNVHGYHKTVFYGGETNTTNHIDNGRVEFPGNIKLKSDGPAGTFASVKVGARNVFQITAPNAPNHYTFNDPDSIWFPTAEDDPTLYLRRGETYYFVVNASGHPFEIRNQSGGTAWTEGITNNTTASGTIIFKVPMSISDTSLAYQCTSHGNMEGSIAIV